MKPARVPLVSLPGAVERAARTGPLRERLEVVRAILEGGHISDSFARHDALAQMTIILERDDLPDAPGR